MSKRSLGQGNIFTPVCHYVHGAGCFLGGMPGGDPPPLRTATAAGGMHPTGMHSCNFLVTCVNISRRKLNGRFFKQECTCNRVNFSEYFTKASCNSISINQQWQFHQLIFQHTFNAYLCAPTWIQTSGNEMLIKIVRNIKVGSFLSKQKQCQVFFESIRVNYKNKCKSECNEKKFLV